MKKIVSHKSDTSLEELEINPGEIVGFECKDSQLGPAFILAIPEALTRGHYSERGIKFSFSPQNSTFERWTLSFRGRRAMELLPPYLGAHNEHGFDETGVFYPSFSYLKSSENVFPVERAYSGRESVLEGLGSMGISMDLYAKMIKDKALIIKGNYLGDLIRRTPLGMVFPNIPRFDPESLGYKSFLRA